MVDNKGNFIPRIPKESFRVLEDGVPQTVSSFGMGEGAMTVCMVIEFSNLYQRYWTETWYQTLTASYGFLETLKPEDYVAVVAYDLRPEILSDFSTDKQKAYEAMQRLRIPAFSESNLYDALVDTAERMNEIEGRKGDRADLDRRGYVQQAHVRQDAQGAAERRRADLRHRPDADLCANCSMPTATWARSQRLDFLQADNQMRTFAKETGGMSFFPRFYGEFPGIFRVDLGFAPQPVHDDVQPDQSDSRRQVPQDQGRTGESGDQRTASCRGPEGQADQVHDHREAGLHGASRGRVRLSQKAGTALAQPV